MCTVAIDRRELQAEQMLGCGVLLERLLRECNPCVRADYRLGRKAEHFHTVRETRAGPLEVAFVHSACIARHHVLQREAVGQGPVIHRSSPAVTSEWNGVALRATFQLIDQSRRLRNDSTARRSDGSFRNDPRITLLTILLSASRTPRQCMQE